MKRSGIVFLACLSTLACASFGQSRAVELNVPAPSGAALSATKVTLILEDETPGGGKAYTMMSGHLEAGRGVVWERREVMAVPVSEPARSTEISDLFGGTRPAAYAQPILRGDLPGTSGAPLQALAFSGGGIKGLAYAGALQALEAAKLMPGIKRFSGASAGAITATLLAAGYDAVSLERVMRAKDFGEFLDEGLIDIPDLMKQIKSGTFNWGDPMNYAKLALLTADVGVLYGVCRGDKFQAWMEEMLKSKGLPGATFGDFAARGMDLNIVLCDATRGQVFIANAQTSKDAKVVDAVRISMSIPVVFRPVTSESGGVKTYWVDGGTMYNYPVDLFDRDPSYDPHSTMGFLLDSEASIRNPKPAVIGNALNYMGAISTSVMRVQTSNMLRAADDKRTVFIDTGEIGGLDFSLTDEQKTFLVKSGQEATIAYLKAHGYAK